MQSFKIFRVRPILHSFNFLGIHPYTILANNMTKVLNFRGTKNTFRMFEENLVLGEEMENLIYMGEMGWPT
jgi:hypothetical protein